MGRQILGLVCAVWLAVQGMGTAWASWPQDGPITLIVPFPVESSSDRVARLLAGYLTVKLGQTVRVHNISGGGGKFGFSALAAAEPDGYTVGILSSPRYLSFLQFPETNYTFESFKELACLTSDPSVLLVRKDSPFKTLADVVAYARANPGVLRYGTSGVGTEDHIAAYKFAEALDLYMVHEPFHGSTEASEALLHGKVPLLFSNVAESQRAVFDETVYCLGQFADDRSPVLPNIPTAREQGYEVVMSSVRGVAMPVGGAPDLERVWVKVLAEVAADPEFQLDLQREGLSLTYFGPQGFCARLVLAKSEFEQACFRFP